MTDWVFLQQKKTGSCKGTIDCTCVSANHKQAEVVDTVHVSTTELKNPGLQCFLWRYLHMETVFG